jgi:tetratricopeptide (TPR) repeat protein
MAAAVAAGVALAHASALDGAFVMDDRTLVTRTAHEHADDSFWHAVMMYGGNGAPTAGRPVVALSFMLNLALAEQPTAPDPLPFHLFNIGVHLAVALLLLTWLRRVLARVPALAAHAPWLALASALLWALHPIHTAAITYVAQRAEALMALGLIGSLYSVTRAADAERPRAWLLLAVACGWLSVLSKEVGAMCLPLVLLYDRALLAGSFAGALTRRRGLYLGLLSTWLLLGAIVALGPRTASVGFDGRGLTWLNYLLTQGNAIVHYLGLLAVPAPLLIDYGWPVVPVDGPGDLVGALHSYAAGLAITGALFLGGLWALLRRPLLGFAAAFFFLILAPSSSVIPVYTEIMAEHRMYLPSLVPITLAVVALYAGGRRLASAAPLQALSERFWLALGLGALLAVATVLGVLTREQNLLYASELRLWMHHLQVQPDNPRLLLNIGRILQARGDAQRAGVFLEQSVVAARRTERPRAIFLLEALQSAADQRLSRGDGAGAAELLREAIELAPRRLALRATLAKALRAAGRPEQSLQVWRDAARALPDDPRARGSLIAALLSQGRVQEARQEALKLPTMARGGRDVDAHLAEAARRIGRADLARELSP